MFCPCYSTRHTYWKNQGSIDTAILCTCKSVHDEAMSLLYSKNTFQLMCLIHNPLYGSFNPNEQRLLSYPDLQACTYIRKAVFEIRFGYYREDSVFESLDGLSDWRALLSKQYPHLSQLTFRVRHYITRLSVDVVLRRGHSHVGSLDTYGDAFSSLLLKFPEIDPRKWWEMAFPNLFSPCVTNNTYDVKAFMFYIDGQPVCESSQEFL